MINALLVMEHFIKTRFCDLLWIVCLGSYKTLLWKLMLLSLIESFISKDPWHWRLGLTLGRKGYKILST